MIMSPGYEMDLDLNINVRDTLQVIVLSVYAAYMVSLSGFLAMPDVAPYWGWGTRQVSDTPILRSGQ